MTPPEPETAFAFWVDPRSAIRVQYALPLFHEIDFQVNEGYRRIPHGGVEVGGLLYGRLQRDQLSIEASRPIECDHASGPSFHLSDNDLARLKQSIEASSADPELRALIPLGWFIAHTRGPLQMTARELQLFDQFFPEPGRLTILIKPERFQPTRFSFLLRDQSGVVHPDGTQSSIILPLPGKATKAADPMPAIPAPQAAAVREMPARRSEDRAPIARVAEKAQPIAPERVIAEPPVAAPPPSPPPVAAPAPPARPVSKPAHPPVTKQTRRQGAPRLFLILLLAALLGCGIGYLIYMQLPPAVIVIRVQKRANDLLVVWNPVQTQSASYAALRVNNGPPVLLSPEERSSGIAEIPPAAGDIKIEIVAQQWARESHGIVRFLQAR